MLQTVTKRLSALMAVVLLAGTAYASPVYSAESPSRVKEINFVFLHGLGGHSGALQLLQDSVMDRAPAYVRAYEQDHAGITVRVDSINRSYPNDVDIDTWAKNIAVDIDRRFTGRENLVLVGHSMGGKTALYAVAKNIGMLAGRTALVVTINSPVRSLEDYYYVSGQAASNYWELNWLVSGRGAINSLVNYDSAPDGLWVGRNRHWLAFISAESSPLSPQFDVSGIDPLPRDMDDIIVPVSAQHSEGADVIYYGEYSHSDFSESAAVAGSMADQILRYVFGGNLQFSTLARAGTIEHRADLFPGADRWDDLVGGVLAASGAVSHKNSSLWWQEWEDVVGAPSPGTVRSNYEPREADSLLSLTGVKQVGWAADNPEDSRIRIRTRAAPLGTVAVNWSVYQQGLLPPGLQRSHYEVKIVSGTPLADITRVSWETDNTRDLRLRVRSQAESPFRWYAAAWEVYSKETRQRNVIDGLPARPLP
jgi:pimeloyl-ACP methyl ester carboxylesterase